MADLVKYIKFYPGDVNGLLQLFFDNLGTTLGLIAELRFSAFAINGIDASKGIGYEDAVNDIIFRRSIPGLGFTMVFGNLYYAFMALRLMKKKEEEGDTSHTTALPYGVNTPGAFAFVFNIILPAVINGQFGNDCRAFEDPGNNNQLTYLGNLSDSEYNECIIDQAEAAWRAGVVSNFIAGLISVGLGFFGNLIPLITPIVALLTALAGIGISFLGIAFLSQNFAEPIAGLLPLFFLFMTYFADVSFGYVPLAAVVVLLGTILGWADSVLTPDVLDTESQLVNAWGPGTGFEALGDWSQVGTYIGITLPVAIAAAAGSLMNVFSARRAGDDYGIAETMISDGVGTIIGALFGTPFGTSVYIGHPAYKKMGAGVLYSVMNCFFYFIFSMFGIFGLLSGIIPKTAIGPILVYVGLSICKEAMEEAKPRHYPAYMFGILPDFSRWVLQQGASYNTGVQNFGHFGLVAISRSSLLVSLIITSISLVIAAILSLFSIIHQGAAGLDYVTELGYGPGEPDACIPGFGYCNNGVEWDKTTPIRFFGGYMIVAAVCAVFYVFQRFPSADSRFKIPDTIEDTDMEPEFKGTKTTAAI